MDQTIVINYIDDPYRFCFEFGERGLTNEYIDLLGAEVYNYAEQMHKAGKYMEVNQVNIGDYVAALKQDEPDKKWIRGYIRESDNASNDGFRFCSIGDGLEFQVEANCLVSLAESKFTELFPARNYVGGLCDSRPAYPVRFSRQIVSISMNCSNICK